MEGYNLPDGVSESDIPGNRPQDIAYDKAVEEMSENWAEHCADHECDCDNAIIHRKNVEDPIEFLACTELITKYDPATKEIILWGRGGNDPSGCPFFNDHVEARVEELMER